jgi:hypothetical protein
VIGGIIAAVVAIAGSGAGSVQTAYSSSENCTAADVEANVRLTVYSREGRAACEAVDRVLGQEGSYWRVQPEGSELEGELVCSLAKGSTLVEVRDTGGHFYGNRFCAHLTGDGWTEREGPGTQVERERAEREATAKAAAAQREKQEQEQRDREAAVEQRKQEAQEAHERATEATREKKEEAKRNAEQTHEEGEQRQQQENLEHEEASRRAQEARERKKEEAERAGEQRKDEEETQHANEEAERG